jgi:hypothetical protein
MPNLYEVILRDGKRNTYYIHWRAKTHLQAAKDSLDYAAENHITVTTVEVSTMTEPDAGRPGLVYVVNDTRTYQLVGKHRLQAVR